MKGKWWEKEKELMLIFVEIKKQDKIVCMEALRQRDLELKV